MLFNELIKTAVRESIKRGDETSFQMVRNSLKERLKRSKIAHARGAKPGTKRWENLMRSPAAARRRRIRSKS